jgi:hypothetical protein
MKDRRIELRGRRGRRRKQLVDDPKETTGYWKLRGGTRSHSIENSLWKRPCASRKTDYCGGDDNDDDDDDEKTSLYSHPVHLTPHNIFLLRKCHCNTLIR